jgi:hypothetical protein
MNQDPDQLLGPQELAELLHRSVKTVRLDATRRPEALPPRVVIPGARALLWRRRTVHAWLNQLETIAAERLAVKLRSNSRSLRATDEKVGIDRRSAARKP